MIIEVKDQRQEFTPYILSLQVNTIEEHKRLLSVLYAIQDVSFDSHPAVALSRELVSSIEKRNSIPGSKK